MRVARRPRDDVAAADGDASPAARSANGAPGCGAAQSSSVPSPSRTTKISSSAEWQCGGAPSSCGGSADPVEPGLLRARGRGRVLDDAAVVALDVVEVDDRLRARGRLPATRGPARGRTDSRPARPRPTTARASRCRPSAGTRRRGGAAGRRRARRGRPSPARSVCALPSGAVDEAVAGAHLVRRAVLPERPEPARTRKISSSAPCTCARRRYLARARAGCG